MTEIWKVIENFPTYSVSNIGNVRNNKTNQLKKLFFNINGYTMVNFTLNKSTNQYRVHRLVAEAFILNPENKETVNHKNHKKYDNNIENLEWASMKQQNYHKKSSFISGTNRIVIQYDLKMNFLKTFKSIKDASRSIDKGCIGSRVHLEIC